MLIDMNRLYLPPVKQERHGNGDVLSRILRKNPITSKRFVYFRIGGERLPEAELYDVTHVVRSIHVSSAEIAPTVARYPSGIGALCPRPTKYIFKNKPIRVVRIMIIITLK